MNSIIMLIFICMSLTTTSANFRSGVKMLVIFVVVYYFITLLFFPQLKNFWRFLNPTKDTTNPVYGLLDPLEFSQKALQTSNPTFVLNTRDGRLPSDLQDKMTSGRLNQDEAIRRARSVLTIIKRLDDPSYSNSNPKVVLGKFSGNA